VAKSTEPPADPRRGEPGGVTWAFPRQAEVVDEPPGEADKVNGKTVTRLLSAAQMARYRGWFENARQVRSLTSELEALSLEVAESAEDWG